VTDTRTGLMWAARDNGADINWPSARQYCANFSGGGHKDWRLPTQNELEGLYDQGEAGNYKRTPLIKLSNCCPWTAENRGYEAALFNFSNGERLWYPQSSPGPRALPVRGGK